MTARALTARASCRGCDRPLDGAAFGLGKPPPLLENGELARKCQYGGWVCSRACDEKACRDLEAGMPGGPARDGWLSPETRRHIERNWEVTE